MNDDSASTADAVPNGGGVSSPQSRRRSLHSPWASVVRGDSEHNSSSTAAAGGGGGGSAGISSSPRMEETSASDNSLIERLGSEPHPESSENNGNSNAGLPRRPAWSRPPNGVVESTTSVIGGVVSWPALSVTTRPSTRSLSDASRLVSDGSSPSSQAPIISQPPQQSANSSSNSAQGNHGNSAGNNPNPARPRSRNRGGGGGGGGSSSGTGPSHMTYNQPSLPMPPPFPVLDLPYGVMPAVLDNSVRGPRPIIGGVGVPQSHTGSEHSSQRSNSRRGNYGPRPRGEGQYHNHHGGRRDQDRRDVHHTPQYVPQIGYLPPPLPPGANSFMAPQPMRVFPGQIGYDMAPPFLYVPSMPPESFRPMPIVPPMLPMIFPPANENPLTNMIVKQIDFYFSDDNLVRDNFLRSYMDDQGWVPISLIASFRRVEHLTKDIPLILESLRHSLVVEVQGDKVRRRDEWSKWLGSTGVVNSDSGSRASSSAPESASSSARENASSSSPENALTTSLQEVSLDDAMANTNGTVDAREGNTEMAAARLSEEYTRQHGLGNGDNAGEVQSRSV